MTIRHHGKSLAHELSGRHSVPILANAKGGRKRP